MFQTTDERTLRLGLMALAQGHVGRDQLSRALEDLASNPLQTLSSILRERGFVTETELQWLESAVDDESILPSSEFTFVKSAVQSGRRLDEVIREIPEQAVETVRTLIGGGTSSSPVAEEPAEDPFATLASVRSVFVEPVPDTASSEILVPTPDFPTDPEGTAEFAVPAAFDGGSTLPLEPGEDPYATAPSLPASPDAAELYETKVHRVVDTVDGSGRSQSTGGLSEAFPAPGGPRPDDPFATQVDGNLATGLPSAGLEPTQAGPSSRSGGSAASYSGGGEFSANAVRASAGVASAPRFKIDSPHAQGGLGEVFKATDLELNRLVALKEIKSRYASQPEHQARFKYEAEITGGLEHPGIVPIYGMNEYPDGRPYYAMRFIQGETLKHAIKEYYKAETPKTSAERSLATVKFHELIRSIINACYALEYAHKRGVLHRDIKPDNIMVGPYGETLVVDWGLAKIMGETAPKDTDLPPLRPMSGGSSSTEVGTTVGTPAFMSPEQAAGDNDNLGPTTDIYSLGATLYQIIVGRTPIQANNIIELLTKVKKGDFPAPRAVVPTISPALEAICLKAMATCVPDRYQSCRELARDLERWLADEPVSVYAEPWHVKLARWGRRHRTAVASVFALLSTALVATVIGYVLVNREKARTEQNFQMARSAVEQMLTEVGDVELADVPQMEGVRRKLLDRAKDFYDKFLQERKDDPKLKTETGRAHARLGDIEEMLGQYGDAEPSYKEAITLLEQPAAGGAATELDRKRALARTLGRLGILYRKSNRFVESEASFRKALELRKHLAALPDATPDDQRGLADLRYQLGALLARQGGREGEDEQLYQDAIKVQTELAAKDAGNLALRAERARSLNNLGILQKTSGKPKEAEATWNEALKVMEELSQAEAGVAGHRWQLGRILTNLALIKADTNRSAEAVADFKRGLGYLQTLTGEYPTVPDYPREVSVMLNNLAIMEWFGIPARPDSAEKDFKDAIAFQEELVRKYPTVPDHRQKLATSELHLAGFYELTRPAEAEALYRRAIDRMARMTTEYPTVPEYKGSLGLTYFSLGAMLSRSKDSSKLPEAIDLLRKAAENHVAAAKASPRNDRELEALKEALQLQCILLVMQGQPDDIINAARQLAKVRPDDPKGYALAASFLAKAAGGATLDLKTSDRLGGLAVELLEEGAKKGRIEPEQLNDPVWKPIEARPDFQKVRDEIRARGAKVTT